MTAKWDSIRYSHLNLTDIRYTIIKAFKVVPNAPERELPYAEFYLSYNWTLERWIIDRRGWEGNYTLPRELWDNTFIDFKDASEMFYKILEWAKENV